MTENPDSDRGRQPEEVEISFEADKSSWLGNYRLLRNLQNEIQAGKSGVETVAIVVEGSRHSYPVDGLAALLREFLLVCGTRERCRGNRASLACFLSPWVPRHRIEISLRLFELTPAPESPRLQSGDEWSFWAFGTGQAHRMIVKKPPAFLRQAQDGEQSRTIAGGGSRPLYVDERPLV